MTAFPDESLFPKGDNSDPIRSGSIGINRILGYLIDASTIDRKPQFNSVIISAFTFFRNVWASNKNATIEVLEAAFVRDVNLFLEYYSAYLSFTLPNHDRESIADVIVYFPNYHKVPKEIVRDMTGQKLEMWNLYKSFLNRYNAIDAQVRKIDHCRCFFIRAGDGAYPHKEVISKFRTITVHPHSLYTSGDPIGLITHIPLDLHMSYRLRNINLIESYTGKVRLPIDFRLKLDKEGRVPFNSVTHVVFGDDELIKPMVSHKLKKDLLEAAVKDRWLTRSEGDVLSRIALIMRIPKSNLSKYNFS